MSIPSVTTNPGESTRIPAHAQNPRPVAKQPIDPRKLAEDLAAPDIPTGITRLIRQKRAGEEQVVVCYGERHLSGNPARDTLRKLIPELPRLGFTGIALEIPSDIDDYDLSPQPILDVYNLLKEDLGGAVPTFYRFQELLSTGKERISSLTDWESVVLDWISYHALATEHELEVTMVDIAQEQHQLRSNLAYVGFGLQEFLSHNLNQVASLQELGGDPKEIERLNIEFLDLYLAMFKIALRSIKLDQERDKAMADNLQNALEINSGHLLFTGGAAHTGFFDDSAARILQNRGTAVVAIDTFEPRMFTQLQALQALQPQTKQIEERYNQIAVEDGSEKFCQHQRIVTRELTHLNNDNVRRRTLIVNGLSNIQPFSTPERDTLYPTRNPDCTPNAVGERPYADGSMAKYLDAVICCAPKSCKAAEFT